MKSQKGVTMISLIIYVSSFSLIVALVAGITTFFFNNVEIIDTNNGISSQYNKFNMYILNECKKTGTSLYAWKNKESISGTSDNYSSLTASSTGFFTDGKGKNNAFITFLNDEDEKNSFIYVSADKNLYYNSIKLCEKVNDFKFKIDYSSGKTVLNIYINIDGKAFNTEYVVNS